MEHRINYGIKPRNLPGRFLEAEMDEFYKVFVAGQLETKDEGIRAYLSLRAIEVYGEMLRREYYISNKAERTISFAITPSNSIIWEPDEKLLNEVKNWWETNGEFFLVSEEDIERDIPKKEPADEDQMTEALQNWHANIEAELLEEEPNVVQRWA